VRYSYRNTRNINAAEFESRLLAADIVTDPPDSPDEFVDRLESAVVDILDELAPVRLGNRPQGRKSARWLSDEAIAAKRLRRRLERRWKSTRAEIDRVAYREACRKANSLINATRNQHRYQHIMELNGDSRRTWSAVKVLLHGESAQNYGKPAENAAFCNTLSTFFCQQSAQHQINNRECADLSTRGATVVGCAMSTPADYVRPSHGRRGPTSAEVDAVEVVST